VSVTNPDRLKCICQGRGEYYVPRLPSRDGGEPRVVNMVAASARLELEYESSTVLVKCLFHGIAWETDWLDRLPPEDWP
jgi:hypothetical protein